MHPPSVDALARSLDGCGLPHPILVEVAREAIALGGDRADIEARARAVAQTRVRSRIVRVVNATGVLLHTNLGRAPLGAITLDPAVNSTYTNLELDLHDGGRGDRQDHVGPLVASACGAEAAVVVNNGAAAVLLVLAALAADRGVAVSRGELVEIGGGFRVPEVMEQSGARLVEVGSTNRTRPSDFTGAVVRGSEGLGPEISALLSVHRSNFRMVGFTESVNPAELAALAQSHTPRPVVVADLGSGLLDSACPWLPGGPPRWLDGEPAARQTLAAGADLVTFSCDKLLGGPQAGVVAGRRDLVARCAGHPLARALRPGGLVLAALQSTLLAYLRRDWEAIPFWRMATAETDVLRSRAEALRDVLAEKVPGLAPEVVRCASVAGGGTLPGVEIDSAGLALPGDLAAALRAGDPPVVARVAQGRTVLDLRTVDPGEDDEILAALCRPGLTAVHR